MAGPRQLARLASGPVNALEFLIPISIALGAFGLAVFLWATKSGQYEDVAGAAQRIFIDEQDKPL